MASVERVTRITRNQLKPATTHKLDRQTILSGLIAGLCGGLLLSLVMMWGYGELGLGLLAPFYFFASVPFGVAALVDGWEMPLAGFLVHLGVSGALGVIFTSLSKPRPTTIGALMAGIVYALSVWLVLTFMAVPWVAPTLNERIALLPYRWLLGHFVFGATFSAVPSLRVVFADRPQLNQHRERERFSQAA